mmetsp:Transcript_99631/g.319728  ORF Transcript_99631/g.319728 Transcript_99631/m.319728 type:complete len:412 (+) Transcript_99631:480-1715(+)
MRYPLERPRFLANLAPGLLGTRPAEQSLILATLVVLRVVSGLPAAQANICLLLVPSEVFVSAESRAIVSDLHRSLLGDMLVGMRLDELPNPQTTRVAARGLRRQGVVGADDFVAIGHISLDAEEEATVVAQVLLEVVPIPVHHLHMLAGDLVGNLQHLCIAIHDDDLAPIPPRNSCGLRRGNDLQLLLNPRDGVHRELFGGRDQDRGGVVPVLRLAQKVGRGDLGVHGVVAEQERLRGAGQEIDADLAEDLLLRLGDEGVAGARDEVHAADGLGAVGHGGDGLGAAHEVDFVRAGHVHRDDGQIGRPARIPARHRGRAREHALAARDLGRQHRHVGRSDHWKFAARHVATDVSDRQMFVAQDDTRLSFHLNILHGVPLQLSKSPDVVLRVLDVRKLLRAARLQTTLDVRFG